MNVKHIDISHHGKCLFPATGLAKLDTADYYRRIAHLILRRARDRPLTFKVHPQGIQQQGFFYKNIPDHFPNFIPRVQVPLKTSKKRFTQMAAAAATRDLIYFAGQNVIELHAALATATHLDTPDQIVLDLDPSDGNFGKVRKVARRCLSMCDQIGLCCLVKLTGSQGLHLHIPIRAEANFAAIKPLARRLAEALVEAEPELTTLEQRKQQRDDKVFVDYLRNDTGQTVILPYSLRARPGAPIATPIRRDELKNSSLQPDQYTARNIFRRLAQIDDPWQGFRRHRIGLSRLENAIKHLSS